MNKSENNFLIVYSYKDKITMTIFYYAEDDIYNFFGIISNLIVKNIPFVDRVIKNLIIKLYSNGLSPELGLNCKKQSEHLHLCCNDNKIFIDENKDNIRVSFRDITITYKLDV